jgi:hypothetical protein
MARKLKQRESHGNNLAKYMKHLEDSGGGVEVSPLELSGFERVCVTPSCAQGGNRVGRRSWSLP